MSSTEMKINGISPAMIGGLISLIVVIAGVVLFFTKQGPSIMDDDNMKFAKQFKKVVDDPMVANSGRMTIKVVEDYIKAMELLDNDADASDKAKKWSKDNISATGLSLLKNNISDQTKFLTTTLAELKILDKQVKEIKADKSTDKCVYMSTNADKINEFVNADISGPERADLFQTLFEVKTLRETLKLDECATSGVAELKAIVDQIESGVTDPVGIITSSLELCSIAKTDGFVDNFTEDKYKKFAEGLKGMCGMPGPSESEIDELHKMYNDAKFIKELTGNSTATDAEWCKSGIHSYTQFADMGIPPEMIDSPLEPLITYVQTAVKGAFATGRVPMFGTCPPPPVPV